MWQAGLQTAGTTAPPEPIELKEGIAASINYLREYISINVSHWKSQEK
jgi:hypothetical protein